MAYEPATIKKIWSALANPYNEFPRHMKTVSYLVDNYKPDELKDLYNREDKAWSSVMDRLPEEIPGKFVLAYDKLEDAWFRWLSNIGRAYMLHHRKTLQNLQGDFVTIDEGYLESNNPNWDDEFDHSDVRDMRAGAPGLTEGDLFVLSEKYAADVEEGPDWWNLKCNWDAIDKHNGELGVNHFYDKYDNTRFAFGLGRRHENSKYTLPYAPSPDVTDLLVSLYNYPLLDEMCSSEKEHEAQMEEWQNWAGSQFQDYLANEFDSRIEVYNDDHGTSYEIADLEGEELLELWNESLAHSGAEWVPQSDGSWYINVQEVVDAVDLDQIGQIWGINLVPY